MAKLRGLPCLVTLFFILSAPALAQLSTATMTGRVVDPSGAVVPRVSVTVVNTATSFKFVATTNDEGLFRVLSLQPGT